MAYIAQEVWNTEVQFGDYTVNLAPRGRHPAAAVRRYAEVDLAGLATRPGHSQKNLGDRCIYAQVLEELLIHMWNRRCSAVSSELPVKYAAGQAEKDAHS